MKGEHVFALLVPGGEDPHSHSRSRAALACYRDGCARMPVAPRVIVSGGVRPGAGAGQGLTAQAPTEAEHMARWLLAAGVPAEHVWLETRARDTLGNVVLGVGLALSRGISARSVVIVSDDFHLPRCCWLFERVFGHAPQGAVGTGVAGTWRLRWREPLAWVALRCALARARVAAGDVAAHQKFVQCR